jgi:hypothetical protein
MDALAEHMSTGTTKGEKNIPKHALTHQLLQNLLDWLKPNVNTLFNKVDDSLFDQVERSGNSQFQQQFLETMRLLRVERKNIEYNFYQGVRQTWSQVKSSRPLNDAFSFDSLSLLDKDELEEQVAQDAMIERVQNDYAENLEFLLARCQHLMPNIQPDAQPFHPRFICNAFSKSLSTYNIDMGSKLIILKLFDRHLLSLLSECLQQANHCFEKAGVLPELQSKQRQARRVPNQHLAHSNPNNEQALNSQAQIPANMQSGIESETLPQQNFNDLRALLGQGMVQGAHSENGQAAYAPTMNIATAESMAQVPELLSVLNQFQATTQAIDLPKLQALIQQNLPSKTIKRVDSDALNLVAMLFEFILGDPQLSIHMKELLGRLQIPILKVAVLDHNFFSDALHPARRLLNNLARAGQAWNPTEDLATDKYYQLVAKIIHRVASEFKDDMQLFVVLDEKLDTLLQHKERRQDDKEQKLKVKEEAQAQAYEEMQALCGVANPPEFIEQFLTQQWVEVLAQAILKQNKERHEQGQEIAEDLLWSIQPQQMQAQRSLFLKVVPKLLKTLRHFSEEFTFNENTMKSFFNQLQNIHLSSMIDSPVEIEELKPAVDITEEPDLNALDNAENNDSLPNNVLSFQPIKNQKTQQNIDPITPCDEEFYDQVSHFICGTRFEMEKDGLNMRCKLAVVIKSVGKYIFVDRHGIKVDEKNTDQMALALQDGTLKHLDDSQLFDRALEAVIGSLREQQAG